MDVRAPITRIHLSRAGSTRATLNGKRTYPDLGASRIQVTTIGHGAFPFAGNPALGS
jgi:hypothetical protein